MLLFAKRIRELRKSNGLTQEELGKLVNISKVSISFYESGARMPSLDTLTALCDVFKVDLEYLLGQDNYVVEESKKEYGITMSNEEIRIIEELRKHPKLYNRLIENPERMINSLDKRWHSYLFFSTVKSYGLLFIKL